MSICFFFFIQKRLCCNARIVFFLDNSNIDIFISLKFIFVYVHNLDKHRNTFIYKKTLKPKAKKVKK
jgi:hypothetical protein